MAITFALIEVICVRLSDFIDLIVRIFTQGGALESVLATTAAVTAASSLFLSPIIFSSFFTYANDQDKKILRSRLAQGDHRRISGEFDKG